MNWLSQYSIKFSGLSEGMHLFGFSADKRFFAEFEEGDLEEGNVRIEVELEKRSTYLRLNFIVSGEVELVCDRCLEKYRQMIQSRTPMLVKFSDEDLVDTDEVIYLHHGDSQVDLGKLIYELIVLSIPIRHVHPDDEQGESLCDKEMLKKIDEYRIHGVEKGTDTIDPRWNDLRKIIGN